MQSKSLNHLNDSQHDAVMHNEGPALIIAGPGSGKTRVITSRIAWLVENNTSIHQIAALTFTNIDQLVLETQEKMKSVYKELTASIK